jgi:hypothetical protein
VTISGDSTTSIVNTNLRIGAPDGFIPRIESYGWESSLQKIFTSDDAETNDFQGWSSEKITAYIDNLPNALMYITGGLTPTSGTGRNKIAGSYGDANLRQFTQSGGTLTYIGEEDYEGVILVTVSCLTNIDNFEEFTFSVDVSGVEQEYHACTTTSNSDDPSGAVFQVPVTLSEGDTIEVFGEHTSGISGFTVNEMQVSFKR